MAMTFPKILISLIVLLMISGLATACSGKEVATAGSNLAPADALPDDVRRAPVSVQQAYRFALANPDVIQQIPCYCGCGAMGHTSNYDCYISGVGSDGQTAFDTHALGCSICVDITQDTMRLIKQGKSLQEVRAYVDQTYSQYGPSNIP